MKNETGIRKDGHRGSGRFHTLLGAAVAVMGLFWLTNKIDLASITTDGSNIVWPIIAIAIGLWFVFKRSGARALSLTSHRKS
jgi:hypothetical protein